MFLFLFLFLSLSLAGPPTESLPTEEEGCLDTTPKAIETARALEQAFLDAEEDQFLRLHRELRHEINCMVSAPAIRDVAQLHRSLAIWQYVSGQYAASRGSWSAVRALDPMWSIEPWGLPDGHQLRQLWDEAPKDTSRQSLRSPPGGWLIDGKPDTLFPSERPALIQGFYRDKSLWHASVAKSMAEVPTPPEDEEKKLRKRKSIRLGGSIGAGTMLVTAGALYGVASTKHAKLNDGAINYNDLDDTKHSINTLTATSLVFGGLGATTATLTWAIKW
jgi:hypothetical protein